MHCAMSMSKILKIITTLPKRIGLILDGQLEKITPENKDGFLFTISFSFSDGITAQYLNLILQSLNIKSYLYERSRQSNCLSFTEMNKVHFAIIPSQYNDVLNSENHYIEKEVKWIIDNYPKCRIIFVRTSTKAASERIRTLIRSSRCISQAKIEVVTLSVNESFLNLTQKIAGHIMPLLVGTDYASNLSKPVGELISVTKESRFTDLFKMTTLGVRHCPVLDPKTETCSRIVSRRDLVKLVPPGNMLLPQQVQERTGITISAKKLIDLIEDLGEKTVGELFPDYELVSVKPDTPISKVVEILAIRHQLAGKMSYISGVPILDGSKFVGFISYADVLEKFIKHQADYMRTPISRVARMESDDTPLWLLHKSQSLSDAMTYFQNVRSLPVVDKRKSKKLVGFIEDVQAIACNHEAFVAELSTLGVEYFMTPTKNLFTPMPGQLLEDCIDVFYNSSNGTYAPSTLAVCDIQNGDDKEIKGVLSYVDILSGWLKTQ